MNNGDHAKRFIKSLVRGMEIQAHSDNDDWDDPDTPSSMKDRYGDTWRYIFGIHKGIGRMRVGKAVDYDFVNDEPIHHGISDKHWRDHYDKYGYGPYGDGLKLGKRLAFYEEDTDFKFVEPEDDQSEELEFTFVE